MSYLYLKMSMNIMVKMINDIICFVSFILISTFRRFHSLLHRCYCKLKKKREHKGRERHRCNAVQRMTVAFDRGCHEHSRSLSSCLSSDRIVMRGGKPRGRRQM